MKKKHICPHCNQRSYVVLYQKYDAKFCMHCNVWLESKCSDLDCEFCSKRPDVPLPDGFKNHLSNVWQSTIEWIPVTKELPVIPEGQHGVAVLTTSYDEVYEELCPGKGKDFHLCSYGPVEGHALFKGSNITHDFMELYYGGPEGSEFGPVGDPVLYWSYVPDVNFLPVI